MVVLVGDAVAFGHGRVDPVDEAEFEALLEDAGAGEHEHTIAGDLSARAAALAKRPSGAED